MAAFYVFSNLDIVKGYYQVEMFLDNIAKTAIITLQGPGKTLTWSLHMEEAFNAAPIFILAGRLDPKSMLL